MNKDNKNLLENFISLGALQIISYVIPLLTLPYQSRVLGVEKFGLVYFAYAFMTYFMVLTDFGFNLSATREVAVNRHNKNNISNIFSSVTCIKILLVVISYLVLLIVSLFVPKIHDNWLIFQLSFLMVIGNAIYPVWFFQGMERMKYITFLNILAKVLFLILLFVFVKHQSDYILVPLLNSLGFLVSGIIGMYFAIKHLGAKLYIPSFNSIKKQFKYSSEFFLSRVSVTLYTNTNSFCLGLISSTVMVGYYVAAEKIYAAIGGLVCPLTNAIYPFIAKNKDIKLFRKIFIGSIIINIFICSFVFIFAPQIVNIFYGAEMLKANEVLRIFCLITLVSVPHMLIGYPLLGAMGYTKEVNASVVISSIIHIIGLATLYIIGKINIYSIAYMAMITETLIFILRGYWVCKYKLLNVKRRMYEK